MVAETVRWQRDNTVSHFFQCQKAHAKSSSGTVPTAHLELLENRRGFSQ